jgi:hypothetical protein
MTGTNAGRHHLLGRPTTKLRRPRPERHLTRGNDKVGPDVFTFNLPAVLTCPGMSAACEACYARRGRWGFDTVQEALARNWEASREPFFAERMIREIRQRRARVVRVHCSGDFYDLAYVRKWARVIRNVPGVRFYAYTRSWRRPGLRRAIEEQLVPLANLRLWYSADADTGLPDGLPPGVRVAWLMTEAEEVIPDGVDLVFRVHRLRRRPAKRIGLALVCPPENGITEGRIDCGRCGVCWK